MAAAARVAAVTVAAGSEAALVAYLVDGRNTGTAPCSCLQ